LVSIPIPADSYSSYTLFYVLHHLVDLTVFISKAVLIPGAACLKPFFQTAFSKAKKRPVLNGSF